MPSPSYVTIIFYKHFLTKHYSEASDVQRRALEKTSEGSKVFHVFSTVIRKNILALVYKARDVQFDHISIDFFVSFINTLSVLGVFKIRYVDLPLFLS